MEKSVRLVQVTDALANSLEVLRKSESAEGFQRNLSGGRVKKMAAAFGNGITCPPIFVGLVAGKHILIDGQHRFEAWKIKKFQLAAQITEMSMADALKNFLVINSTSVAVPFALRLSIDPSEHGKMLRAFAEKYHIDLRMAYSFVAGQSRDGLFYKAEQGELDRIFRVAEIFAKAWTKDRRWKLSMGVFCSTSVIRALTRILKTSNDPVATVAEFLKMDYSKNGPISCRIMSGTNSAISKVGDYAYKFIAKQII